MNDQSSHAASLALRAHDIVLGGPDGVFAEDCLNRRPAVGLLCDVLATTDSPAVVALNGEFGAGKTTFLKMCAAVLRERDVTVVETDAWQQRYTGDALVDLVGALSEAVPAEQKRLLEVLRFAGRIARGAAWSAASQLSGGMLGPVNSDGGNATPIADWHEFKEARSKLRAAIGAVAEAEGGRIVFIVDELDRCPPAYALDMLDRVRNVLDISGVIVLYGITRSQLDNAVQQEQGAGCDAGAYLARFFDREIQLRAPNPDDSHNFVLRQAAKLPHIGALHRSQQGGDVVQLMGYAAALMRGRLRDIQQLLCAADTVLWLARRDVDRDAALVLLTLKHVARDSYDKLIAGNINGYEAAAALKTATTGVLGDRDNLTHWLQANLILHSPGGPPGLPESEEFEQKFTVAGAGTADEASLAHETLTMLRRSTYRPPTWPASLSDLTSLVEMSEPPA